MSERCHHCEGVAYCPACDVAELAMVRRPDVPVVVKTPGCSIEFWAASLKRLTKIYGDRSPGNLLEDIRSRLAEVEMLYQHLPAPRKEAPSA